MFVTTAGGLAFGSHHRYSNNFLSLTSSAILQIASKPYKLYVSYARALNRSPFYALL